MALYRDNDAVAPQINDLSFQITTGLVKAVYDLQGVGHTQSVAVTIALDAVLLSAISLLKTAVENDMIGLTEPVIKAIHHRVDELGRMQFRVHAQQADGSFDPTGQAFN